jgi:hypothetical protein
MESYYQEAGMLYRKGDAELHRRQLEVTFPPPRMVERVWRSPESRVGVPENVLASVERLRNELFLNEGPVDWSGVLERRRRAHARLRAMERYVTTRSCRRGALLGYFGERAQECAGCDRCRAANPGRPTNPDARRRMRRLSAAVGSRQAPWGGAARLLSGTTLRGLAESPPRSVDGLASFPGVGPVVAERLGGTILSALGTLHYRRLRAWRDGTARAMSVPSYTVVPDVVLRRIVESAPRDRAELSRVPGMGPRSLMAFGDEILSQVSAR